MFRLFRKKKEHELIKIRSNLSNSFSRLGNDIDYIQRWVRHIHEKNEHLENKHDSHIEITRRDVESLTKWVQFLNKHNLELQNHIKDLSFNVKHLEQKDDQLIKKIEELENKLESSYSLLKGHLGTLERTTKGQLKDISFSIKDTITEHLIPIQTDIKTHKEEFIIHKEKLNNLTNNPLISNKNHEKKEMFEDLKEVNKIIQENQNLPSTSSPIQIKPTLSGSQIELLNVLYEADRPLSYADLSKILNKKSKSIRNLIYELREAGIDVKSRFVGLRKKGFYLTKETKILISGR